MERVVGIGHQDFETVIKENIFYVDKTHFIREWWEARDIVTLITRPRRFGKTLNMSMTEQFFSVKYAGRGDLFEGLSVWKDEKYRGLQGTYPVIALSFARVKATSFSDPQGQAALQSGGLQAVVQQLSLPEEVVEQAPPLQGPGVARTYAH